MFTYSVWVTWMLHNHDNCRNIWEKRTWLNMWSRSRSLQAPSIREVEWRSRFCHRWPDGGPTVEYRLQPATHIQRRPNGGPTVEYRLRPATHIQRRPNVVVLSGTPRLTISHTHFKGWHCQVPREEHGVHNLTWQSYIAWSTGVMLNNSVSKTHVKDSVVYWVICINNYLGWAYCN